MEYTWKTFTSGGWTAQPWTAAEWNDIRIDPYLVWADATDFADLGGLRMGQIPIIIELKKPRTAEAFAREVNNDPYIHVSPFYALPASGLEKTTFCTATVKREFFLKLVHGPWTSWIERFEIGLPVRSSVDPVTLISPLQNGQIEPKEKVQFSGSQDPPNIVGVIDDGLAFAHWRFREPCGKTTRVDYFCDQGYAAGEPQARVNSGRELTKANIDGYMAAATQAGLVNEDAVYRKAKYGEVNESISHGTHVMDLLCGGDPGNPEDEAAEARIIGVQIHLPCRRTRDTSGRSLALHALNGMRYILDRADSIARAHKAFGPSPVVINLSYGNFAGPHNGCSMLECAMDELREMRDKLSVVLPAGNNYLTRCHAAFELESKGEKELNWRVQPDDATPNFMEIWAPPERMGHDFSVEVIPPWGTSNPANLVGKNGVRILTDGKTVICTVVYLEKVATGDRPVVLVALAPTLSLDSGRKAGPSGIWRIRIKNNADRKYRIAARIQRDDTPFSYRLRGRQSRFEDAKYVVYDYAGRFVETDDQDYRGRPLPPDKQSYVKREETINGIATGRNTVIAGSYRRSDGKTALYSASARNFGPDALLVSDDSWVQKGVLAAGSRSGSIFAMNGTSVAAPQLARTLVPPVTETPIHDPQTFRRAPGWQADRVKVQSDAINYENNLPNHGVGHYKTPTDNYPLRRFGKGRIEPTDRTLKVKR